MDFQKFRREFTLSGLSEGDLADDPFVQFEAWFDQAVAAGIEGPEAMTLATADAQGVPAARIVLLKRFSPEGFTFFTNLESAKAEEMKINPQAALLFFWKELERQVRITGRVEPVGREASVGYFHTRPRGSQVGAWASPQSRVVSGRAELEAQYAEYDTRFAEGEVPLPDFWGGYRIVPHTIEFWQGRVNRLHDRLRFRRPSDSAPWTIDRLAP